MGTDRRGIQQIRTIAGLVDGRRARTSAGALLELSMLEMEKTRLMKEIARADRRCAEVRRRLAEITAKQERIHRFVDRPPDGAAETAPLPRWSAPPEKVKRRRLAY
jgi:predicted nuclease with TOPRIM domain